ncbi:71592329-7be6-4dfd-bd73-1f652fb1f664 [Sclerotinia trifoliorum]|uniref:71592329-7be6-4dfd-bd73-1f652fb1f664 n=1 Tax=Sclerotinia trifoliorum TaxID=28548 RepID=A0A8H2W0K1_9HELO|nr:71592329-7be6-4dfd-bd73-1f652fb1f664 [Sclerotinia trifoliorum]
MPMHTRPSSYPVDTNAFRLTPTICCLAIASGSPPLHSGADVLPRVITIIPAPHGSNPGTATMPIIVKPCTRRAMMSAPHHSTLPHHASLHILPKLSLHQNPSAIIVTHKTILHCHVSQASSTPLAPKCPLNLSIPETFLTSDFKTFHGKSFLKTDSFQISIGFGFPVGDFIAAIDLVATVIDALRESSNSSSEFREIVRQLDALEDTLRCVKRLELDDTQCAERDRVAKSCFLLPSRLGWHTSLIQLLITTIQLASTARNEKNQASRCQTLAGRTQDGESWTPLRDQKYSDENKPQDFPNRVGDPSCNYANTRPVTAFLTVLKTNFVNIGQAASKIENGDFAIRDSATRRDVRVEDDWELWFSPGQRVEMSLIFRRDLVINRYPDNKVSNHCPRCKTIWHIYQEKEFEW